MSVLTSALAGGLSLLTLLQTTVPVTDALRSFNEEIANLRNSRNLTEETYYAAADKAAAKIDFAALDVAQAVMLAGHPIAETSKGYAGISARAKAMKVDASDAGFQVSVLQAMVSLIESRDGKTGSAAERAAALKTMIEHEKAKPILSSMAGSSYLNALASASASGSLSGAMMSKVADQIAGGVNPMLAPALSGVWDGYADGKSASPEFDAIWKKFHDGMTATLAAAEKMEQPNPRLVQMIKRTVSQMESPAGRGRLVGFPAPNVTFQWNSDGKAKTLADYKGKVVVLDFWATWCGPCIASMPKLRELTTHYQGKPVVVLAVTSIQGMFVENGQRTPLENKPAEEIAMYPGYMERQKINWTVAVSNEDVFNPDFGVQGIPYMAIIDAKGVVRHAGLHPGALTLEQKQALIDPLLKEIK